MLFLWLFEQIYRNIGVNEGHKYVYISFNIGEYKNMHFYIGIYAINFKIYLQRIYLNI